MDEFDIEIVQAWREQIKEEGYSTYVKILDDKYVFCVSFIPNKGSERKFINIIHFLQKMIQKEATVVNYKIRFEEKIRFVEYTHYEKLNFINSEFKGGLLIKNCEFDYGLDFSGSHFYGSMISFENLIFKSKVRFRKCKFFKTINFNNTSFEDLVDFYYSEFNKCQKFYRTDFLDVAIFTGVKFLDQCQFIYCKVDRDSRISFDSTKFDKGIDISRANFYCDLNFWNVQISSDFECVEKNYWLYSTDDIHYLEKSSKPPILYQEALKKLRESLRIVKNTYRISGNNIEAAKFNMKELEMFEKEIKQAFLFNQLESLNNFLLKKVNAVGVRLNTNNIFVKILFFIMRLLCGILKPILYPLYMLVFHGHEGFVLAFNKVSSGYGTSWCRALWFIVIYSLFFYLLLNLSIGYTDFDLNNWVETLRFYAEFLNITNWKLTALENKSYNLGYVVLFVGRIFIAYGYYQLIQAFRKYGKN